MNKFITQATIISENDKDFLQFEYSNKHSDKFKIVEEKDNDNRYITYDGSNKETKYYLIEDKEQINGCSYNTESFVNFISPINYGIDNIFLADVSWYDRWLFLIYKILEFIIIYEIIKSFRKFSHKLYCVNR